MMHIVQLHLCLDKVFRRCEEGKDGTSRHARERIGAVPSIGSTVQSSKVGIGGETQGIDNGQS